MYSENGMPNIKDHLVEDKEGCFVFVGDQKTKYDIRKTRTDYEAFWNCLCKTDTRTNFGIAEIPKTNDYPLTFYVNLRFKPSEDDDDIDIEDFQKCLVIAMQKCALDFFYFDMDDLNVDHLLCATVNREHTIDEEKGILGMEFSISLPMLKTHRNNLLKFKNVFVEKCQRSNYHTQLPYQPIDSADKYIYIPDNYPMLGSGSPPFTLPRFYRYDEENTFSNLDSLDTENDDIPGLENHEHVLTNQLDADYTTSNHSKFYEPMYLSLGYRKIVVNPRSAVSAPRDEKSSCRRERSSVCSQQINLDCDRLESVFMSMLDHKKYMTGEHENELIMIGRCLATIHDQDEVGLQKWLSFVPSARKQAMIEKWETFMERRYTINTLAWIARKNNYEKYSEWHNGQVFFKKNGEMGELVAGALSDDGKNHIKIANLFYRMYFLQYVCVYEGKSINWFGFINPTNKNKPVHRWINLQSDIHIKNIISEDFVRHINDIRMAIVKKQTTTVDKTQFKINEENIKACNVLIKQLGNITFVGQIAKTLPLKFENRQFRPFLDRSNSIIGVENGVLDVDHKTGITFRSGVPEDYISVSLPAKVMNDFTWKSQRVVEVIEWFKKVYPLEDLNSFVWRLYSSILLPGNNDKIAAILTGEGYNSKSMIVRLIELTFGKKIVKMPVSQVTGKRQNAGGATPHLVRLKGALASFIEETDEKQDKISGGVLKSMISTDTMYVRGLFMEGEDIERTDKSFFVCNDPPEITGSGFAIQARVKLVPHLATFYTEDKTEEYKNREYAHPADPNFDKSIPHMKDAFLWILLQKFPEYLKIGLKIPPSVIERTHQYWIEKDVFNKYINEKVIEHKDKKQWTRPTVVFRDFNSWFKENFPGSEAYKRDELEKQFRARFKDPDGGKWYITIKSDEDEPEDRSKKSSSSSSAIPGAKRFNQDEDD